MTVAQIIDQLTHYTGRFPKAAVEAAIAQREAVTPYLLKALDEVANAPEDYAKRTDYMLHTYALYLLAQFRDKRAYPLAIKMVMAPGDLPDDLLGDTLTQGLQNILGSIYDGDLAALKALVEGEHMNEWVRGSALDTFLVLVNSGQMARDEASRYFRSLLEGGLKREHSQAWNELACVIGDLPAPELLDLLRQAYDDNLVDPGYADFKGVSRDAEEESGRALFQKQYGLVQDAVTEMEWWAAFRPDKHDEKAEDDDFWRLYEPLPDVPAPVPIVRQQAKIGRNDPCPCGSGLKYKKCCLDKA
jgi:hypothetical protein